MHFEIKLENNKSKGIKKLHNEKIKPCIAENRISRDHYKNLKFPFDKFINENFYSAWIEGALATCEKK